MMKQVDIFENRVIYSDDSLTVGVVYVDESYKGNLWCLKNSVRNNLNGVFDFSVIVKLDNRLVFQNEYKDEIVLLDFPSCNLSTINAHNLLFKPYVFKSEFVCKNKEQKEVYFFDSQSESFQPTGFKDMLFDYSNDVFSLLCFANRIICYHNQNKNQLWELSIVNLNYDRGGHHYAALTPKNDVPYQCLFHNQLLLALFCTHTAAIDLQTGRVVWEHNIGSEHRYWYHQGRLVLMQGAYIYELCPDTGTVLRENVPFTQAVQLPLLGRKTNMVGNHERIYFCLAEQKEIVTLDAATLQIVAIDKIEHNKEAVLLPPEKIYLSGNKLFITLQCQQPTVHNEILVYEV